MKGRCCVVISGYAIVWTICVKCVLLIKMTCPPGNWTLGGESCYLLVTSPLLEWQEALDFCRNIGYELAVPNSKDENDAIQEIFVAAFPPAVQGPQTRLWVGCHKTEEDGWVCPADRLSWYWNWREGQPSKPKPGCVVMFPDDAGSWGDATCSQTKYTICETEAAKCAATVRCAPGTTAPEDADGHAREFCFPGHGFKTLPVSSPMQCCLACYKDRHCRSFNLMGNICQFNYARASTSDDISFEENCIYYTYQLA